MKKLTTLIILTLFPLVFYAQQRVLSYSNEIQVYKQDSLHKLTQQDNDERLTSFTFGFNNWHSSHNYIHNTFNNLGHSITAPFYWNSKQWLTAGALVTGGIVLYFYDEPILSFINDHKTPLTENLSRYGFEPFGNNYTFAVIACMAGYGILSKHERPLNTALLSVQSFLITGVVTLIPKNLAGRVRPHNTDPLNATEWKGPFGGRSFWSGHTSTVFSVASVIASMYKDKKAVPYIAYSIASLTALSRIHDLQHWPTDVFAGALVGTAIGKLVVNNYKLNQFTLTPVINPYQTGVALSLNF